LLEIPNLDATRNRPQGNHNTLSEDELIFALSVAQDNFWFLQCDLQPLLGGLPNISKHVDI
jgi:hypothetical protein